MPKWLGDLSERTFKQSYKAVTVAEVEYYAKNFKRIRFQGEALCSIPWQAAQEVEFRVSDTEYRHYTPCCWNVEQGYADVLFYLHGQGPGSLWADALTVGSALNLIGPGGKFVLPSRSHSVVMLGDETTLSAFKGMKEVIGSNAQKTCVLEMEFDALMWAKTVGLEALVLQAIAGQRGAVLEFWLQEFVQNNPAASVTDYLLSGNAQTIAKLYKILRAAKVPSKNIYAKPYWAEGKVGL
ncbi:siderophore-interacting protein [Flavobacterium sp. JP2137]|uniref:siderophore-interacting protein n=1 Tax=Flavobacterium sp. JP2137 TaxID=3414510 RepID=UPI003D2FC70F